MLAYAACRAGAADRAAAGAGEQIAAGDAPPPGTCDREGAAHRQAVRPRANWFKCLAAYVAGLPGS
jgi:hypothetical protein